MAIHSFEEYTAEGLSDVRNNVYRATLVRGGQLVRVRFEQYIDADRAGFSGYVWTTVQLPADLITQMARDLNDGQMVES